MSNNLVNDEFTSGHYYFSDEEMEMVQVTTDSTESIAKWTCYNDDSYLEKEITDVSQLPTLENDSSVHWIHILGFQNRNFLFDMARRHGFSQESIDDMTAHQDMPVVEEYPEGLFLSLKMVFARDMMLQTEHIIMILNKNIVVTIQPATKDHFQKVRDQLRMNSNKMRSQGSDVLLVRLLEESIDSYFPVLKVAGERIANLQNRVVRNPGNEELKLILRAKQMLLAIWRSVWPLRNFVHAIMRSKNSFISSDVLSELSVCHDQAALAMELTQTYRELSNDMMDMYVSGLTLRTNKATTVLSVVAALFLPPTLLAGVYGMNFELPEYHYRHAFLVALLTMFVVSGGMFIWLKLKGYFIND